MNIFDTLKQSLGLSKAQRIAYGTEKLQFGDLYLPEGEGPHPVIILIHGGFWRTGYSLSLMDGLAGNLARRGIAAWNIEYRRVGDTNGGWPNTLLDVAHATDHLREIAPTYQLNLERIIPVGHSAGGHLAFWLAARHRLPQGSPLAIGEPLALTAVVSLAGAVDLEHTWRLNLGGGAASALLDGGYDAIPERYIAASPAALLPLGVPQVLIHGASDDHVPLVVSQDYATRASDAGDNVTLVELPGTDHFALIDARSTAWTATLREIQKFLQ